MCCVFTKTRITFIIGVWIVCPPPTTLPKRYMPLPWHFQNQITPELWKKKVKWSELTFRFDWTACWTECWADANGHHEHHSRFLCICAYFHFKCFTNRPIHRIVFGSLRIIGIFCQNRKRQNEGYETSSYLLQLFIPAIIFCHTVGVLFTE